MARKKSYDRTHDELVEIMRKLKESYKDDELYWKKKTSKYVTTKKLGYL